MNLTDSSLRLAPAPRVRRAGLQAASFASHVTANIGNIRAGQAAAEWSSRCRLTPPSPRTTSPRTLGTFAPARASETPPRKGDYGATATREGDYGALATVTREGDYGA